MAPADLTPLIGTAAYVLIFMGLGMAFGAVLEASGFGDSRRLAAQFYLHDMTVLKVMFTAIITAAVLLHLASALGLLNLDRVWVNPTFLAPGIVGGLIMGIGFIIGGFCPGTSLVAAATLKLDGIFFVLGVFGGVALFGETVGRFQAFWHSTSMGRFTLPEWLGLPTGLVVVFLVLMALGMFVAAEASERHFGTKRRNRTASAGDGPTRQTRRRRLPLRVFGAGSLLALAVVTALIGQPDVEQRWRSIADREGPRLANRDVVVHPAEVVEVRRNLSINARILEVRPEPDYNLFHLEGSRRIDPADARDPDFVRSLLQLPENTVVFLIGNGETASTEAWKALRSRGVPNLYIIAGGINKWLQEYPLPRSLAARLPLPDAADDDDVLAWRFSAAIGARGFAAHPDLARQDLAPVLQEAAGLSPASYAGHDADPGSSRHLPGEDGLASGPDTDPDANVQTARDAGDFIRKVKLQKKVVAKGGCG